MSYVINLSTGIVTRISDGRQVAPCQSVDDPDFKEYILWSAAGNHPEEVSIPVSNAALITKLAFRRRFTEEEKVGIDLASAEHADDSEEKKFLSAELRVYIADIESADYVNLGDAAVIAGLNSLVSIGLLTKERVDEILTTAPAQHEIPDGG